MNALAQIAPPQVDVIRADALEALDCFPSGSFDCVITDPPYGIFQKMRSRVLPDGATRTLSFPWDTADTVEAVLKAALRTLKRPGAMFVFAGWDTAEIARNVMREAKMNVRPFAWIKKHPPPATPGSRWTSGFEIASFGFDPGSYFDDARVIRTNVIVEDSLRAGNGEKTAHPTQKPTKVIAPLVKALCPPNGHILDPFAGSGTTGLVARRLGRRATLIEINPDYCAIARQRLGL